MKQYIIGGITLLAALACSRESLQPESVPEGNGLVATIVSSQSETKAILLDNPGVRMESFWQADDHIGVAGSSGQVVDFSVRASDILKDGKTAVFRSEETVPSGDLTAFSPWQENAGVSGGKVTMTLPATQKYTKGNGVAQPDPTANLMVGSGNATGGVSFHNTLSILKIGQTFDKDVVLRQVEFRDRSGAAVAGTVTIGPGSSPVAVVSGSEKVITLDCGEEGLEVKAGETTRFFIIIPARTYSQGVEIAFVTTEGERIVRTSGSSGGVTFERSVIYPVGDIPNRDYELPSAAVLQDGAIQMTPEMLRKIKILTVDQVIVTSDDGTEKASINGVPIQLPAIEMLVPRDMKMEVGNWLVFDATDDLPSGGILKVKEIKDPFGDENHTYVYAVPTINPFAAYKELKVGGQLYGDDGEENPENGLDLDLSKYLSEIRDAEGNSIPFSRNAKGEIVFDQETLEDVATKAGVSMNKTISSPSLNISHSGDNCSASLSASLSVSMRMAMRVEDGKLWYMGFSFNPSLNLSAEFSIKAEGSIGKDIHLITLVFVPGIPIAPGVILTPELDISAGVSVGGSIELKTTISKNFDLGTYGFSYSEQGFTFRHSEAQPAEDKGFHPELGASLTGSVWAGISLTATPSISLYGLLSVGLATEFSLKFGLEAGIGSDSGTYGKLFLTPGLKFTPVTASLGGVFTQKWDDYAPEIEFDPIWERYLFPSFKERGALVGSYTNWSGTIYRVPHTGVDPVTQEEYRYYTYYHSRAPYSVPTWVLGKSLFVNIDGYKYAAVSDKPTLDPWEVVMVVYTGETNYGEWDDIAYVDCLRVNAGDVDWKSYSKVGEYTLMSIPAGSDDEVRASGTFGEFQPGKTYGLSFNYINKRTGKRMFEDKPGKAFKAMWPSNLPCGDPYIWESINERAWDSYVASGYRQSDEFYLEPDGYYDFDPTI